MNINANSVENNTYFEEIISNAGLGIIILNQNCSIVYINNKGLNLFGYNSNELLNSNITKLFNDSDHSTFNQFINKTNSSLDLELSGYRKDSSSFPIEINISSRIINKNNIYTLIIRDITKSKQSEEYLKNQAFFDSLTGIPNRTLFLDRSKIALNQAKRSNESMALIFIDLDEFKELNDNLGHDAGDVMLQVLAERFINCARNSDTVSRRGGDEFTILMPRINNVDDAVKLAERILISNKIAISIKGKMIYPKTSIGISIYPEDGEDIESLINNADKAMYNAKNSGKNQYSIYSN